MLLRFINFSNHFIKNIHQGCTEKMQRRFINKHLSSNCIVEKELEIQRTKEREEKEKKEAEELEQKKEKEKRHRFLSKCQQVNPRFPDIVGLNVGGKLFQTSRYILTKCAGTFLAELFSDRSHRLQKDSKGYIFLDRDADLFSFILTYLRR